MRYAYGRKVLGTKKCAHFWKSGRVLLITGGSLSWAWNDQVLVRRCLGATNEDWMDWEIPRYFSVVPGIPQVFWKGRQMGRQKGVSCLPPPITKAAGWLEPWGRLVRCCPSQWTFGSIALLGIVRLLFSLDCALTSGRDWKAGLAIYLEKEF